MFCLDSFVKELNYICCVMSGVNERSGIGKTHLCPKMPVKDSNSIHSGRQCRVISKVSMVGEARSQVVLGSMCFLNEALVTGGSFRSRTFPGC